MKLNAMIHQVGKSYKVKESSENEKRIATPEDIRCRAHHVIPGGCHTYAKGDDQYPENAPGFIVKGQGCHVWDIHGNKFIEYGMGLRAVTLGHAYPPVVEAACRQMQLGSNFTRPAPIEVECAERLLSLIPGMEMVKFAKNSSDCTTAAVKVARAYTGRDLVAICGDQPFFSIDDWFIGTTPMSAGIPRAIQNLTKKFSYNDPSSLEEIFQRYPGQVACVILEPETKDKPVDDFLGKVRHLCAKNGAVLIFDETITGFRWHLGGAQTLYGVTPDLSVFGKAMANGFSVAALAGKRELMKLGGLHHDKERVFLLSTTHGAETHSLAAAIETMNVYERERVVDVLFEQGEKLRHGIERAAQEYGVSDYFKIAGRACNLVHLTCGQDKQPSQLFRTLFMQEVIRRGVIGPSFVVSFSHMDDDIRRTIDAVHGALGIYRKAIDEGVEKYLDGRSVKPVFRMFN